MMQLGEDESETVDDGYVYSRDVMYNMMSSMTNLDTPDNNLPPFIDFWENDPTVQQSLSAIHYS